MHRILRFIVLIVCLTLGGSSFGQPSPVFLQDIRTSAPGIVELHLPTGLFTAMRPQQIDTSLGTRIGAAMQAIYNSMPSFDKHGIGASVIVPGIPQWSGGVGTYDGVHPMDSTIVFEAASNTKTFVAAIIMRLQDSGRLSIKDSIYKWLPKKYPNVDSAITIKMLLNHSSGIFDFLNDDSTGTLIVDQYFGHPSKRWTPDEILMNHVGKPNFKPGTGYKYCNTNFMLLGLIAEAVDGRPLGVQMHKLLIDPLQLTHTYFGGEDTITSIFSSNYGTASSTYAARNYTDIDKTAQLTGAWSVGNIVTTPADLARWSHALYLGKVVSPASVTAMTATNTWADGSRYGLGTQFAPYYTHSFYGHTGSLPGFVSAQFTNKADSVTVTLFVNWQYNADNKDPYENDYLVAILNEIYKAAPSGIRSEQELAASVSVWPNPATNRVSVDYVRQTEGRVTIEFFDMLGRTVCPAIDRYEAPGIHSATLDVSGLHEGTYLYRVNLGTNMVTGHLCIR